MQNALLFRLLGVTGLYIGLKYFGGEYTYILDSFDSAIYI